MVKRRGGAHLKWRIANELWASFQRPRKLSMPEEDLIWTLKKAQRGAVVSAALL
jgi:hypothetical protein